MRFLLALLFAACLTSTPVVHRSASLEVRVHEDARPRWTPDVSAETERELARARAWWRAFDPASAGLLPRVTLRVYGGSDTMAGGDHRGRYDGDGHMQALFLPGDPPNLPGRVVGHELGHGMIIELGIVGDHHKWMKANRYPW